MKKSKLHYFIQKERNILLAGAVLGLLLAGIYGLAFYVPMYTSSARLYIRSVSAGNVIASYGTGNQVRSESGYSNPLFNYLEILKSTKLSDNIYDKLKTKYPQDLTGLGIISKSKWRAHFGKLLQAKVVPSTDIIKIEFNWNNPETASKVLADLIDEYKQTALGIRHNTAHRQTRYLQEQLDKVKQDLLSVRQQLKDYSTRNQASDLSNESNELTRARVDLQKQAELLRSQVLSSQSRLSDYARQLNIQDAQSALQAVGLGTDPYLVKLNESLALAQQKKAHMAVTMTESHPEMRSVNQEIDNLTQNISERKKQNIGNASKAAKELYDPASISIVTNMAQTQADAISQKSQLRQLLQGINALRREEGRIPLKKLSLSALEQEEKNLANAYDQVLQKYMEAKIKEDQIIIGNNIDTLDTPSRPRFALFEALLKFIALIGLGVLSGTAIAWIKHDIDDRWMDADEITLQTGKRVFGMIPWTKVPSASLAPLPESVEPAYETIVQNLVRTSFLEEAQVIAFLSSAVNRVSSPIICHIARTLAVLGRSVIIVNTNFSEESPLNLGSDNDSSFDLLSMIDEINVRHRMGQSLDSELLDDLTVRALSTVQMEGQAYTIPCLSSARQQGRTFEYVASRGFQILLDRLRQQYEFILIDTPAKSYQAADIQAISSTADGTVILAALSSSRQELIRVIQELEKSHASVIGIVARERMNGSSFDGEDNRNIRLTRKRQRPLKDSATSASSV
jgi:uncharacterized protein involved in exopolysaccharide biosynthesis/Mrp family chromosome partitioning ATPase